MIIILLKINSSDSNSENIQTNSTLNIVADEIKTDPIKPKNKNKPTSDTKIVAALMGFSMDAQFSKGERLNPAFLSDTPIASVPSNSKRPNYSYSYNPKYQPPKDSEIKNG